MLFRNYENGEFLLVRAAIISMRTLKRELAEGGLIGKDADVPKTVEKIYKKSVPDFKTQTHFFGYDGRGSAPTKFDCDYTYNLGMTVFSLVAA